MDDPRKQFLEHFDWKNFEQFFGGKFPLSSTDYKSDVSWVNNVVKDVMKKAFPSSLNMNAFNHHYRAEVFETHNNIVAKIYIGDKEQARNINALIGVNRIKLEGLPDNNTQIIKLTSHIVPESCRAVYKKGILQIHARKAKTNDRLYSVQVRFND